MATELVGYGQENLEILATQFMKNRPSTTSKFYVQNSAQREAERLSLKCYGTFKLDDTQFKGKVPTKDDVRKWFDQQSSHIRKYFREEMNDPELLEAIELGINNIANG